MAKKGVAKHGISVRLACVVYGYGETCYRYQATLDGENALVADWLLKRRLTNAGVLERTAEYGDRRNTSNPAATGRITLYSNGRLIMGGLQYLDGAS